MREKKIIALFVKDNNPHCGVSEYRVGQGNIGTIIYHRIEWDNAPELTFSIYDTKGNLMRQIINFPVDIVYEKLK